MNRHLDANQIRCRYVEAGIPSCQLRNLEDLYAIHGIDFNSVLGVGKLTPQVRSIFERFLINYLNRQGLEARVTIEPISIELARSREDGAYLKFTFMKQGRKTWLHVKSENYYY